MTMMTTTATTDPPTTRTLSARTRIVGWTLLLVGLALAVSIVMTWSILLIRVDDRVDAELANEAAKLRSYATAPTEPGGSTPPRDVASFLARYLAVNVPDRYETLFSVVDGRADRRSPTVPPARLDNDEAFINQLSTTTVPTTGWTESAAGRVRYAVVPVELAGDRRSGALVIVQFRDLQQGEVNEAMRVLGATALGALVVAGLGGWLVAGRVLAPVRLVRQAAERISGSSDLSRRLGVAGNDDVAALARTFNHMLDRLDGAFAAQRRFLDDAGHELRTPITVIRGHLELLADGTDDDPAERAATIDLVMDELRRMHRIVDDLIMLARAGQPDFLAPDEVELADLTMRAVATARPLGDRRWRVAEVAEVQVIADGQRLTQALMQLVANAVRHTTDGDTIEVGSAARDGQVRLWVRDSGPGVAPADRERIFERFVRAGNGVRPPDGAGLGLAIVRSIAHAHGGGVRVEDAEGGGARFVLTLPLRPVASQTEVAL
jgi:signal transduction histidine kinase